MCVGVEYYNGSHEEAWVQVYRGIFLGLGSKNTNFKECVEDGNKTVAAFRKSFKAFEEGQVRISIVARVGGAGHAYLGLTIFAQHSELNTLWCPAQIFPRINQNIVHCALIWDIANDKESYCKTHFLFFQLYKGLQLFGTALIDVKDTLIACLKTDIVKALEKFIKDLLSCTEGNCMNFVIDTLDVLLILFNNIYEIFGDIHSASNAFGLIEGYEQGGLCIGRVVKACISLP